MANTGKSAFSSVCRTKTPSVAGLGGTMVSNTLNCFAPSWLSESVNENSVSRESASGVSGMTSRSQPPARISKSSRLGRAWVSKTMWLKSLENLTACRSSHTSNGKPFRLCQLRALRLGSPSTNRVWALAPNSAAICTALVVLACPPFKEATVIIICGMVGSLEV